MKNMKKRGKNKEEKNQERKRKQEYLSPLSPLSTFLLLKKVQDIHATQTSLVGPSDVLQGALQGFGPQRRRLQIRVDQSVFPAREIRRV